MPTTSGRCRSPRSSARYAGPLSRPPPPPRASGGACAPINPCDADPCVHGSCTGADILTVDALGNVLFHPNPMRDGGHFTFSLSQGSHAVHIQVFSIAGRLVAELQGTGTEGYNQIAWRPDQELANGTYLYKISAGGPEGSSSHENGVIQVMR